MASSNRPSHHLLGFHVEETAVINNLTHNSRHEPIELSQKALFGVDLCGAGVFEGLLRDLNGVGGGGPTKSDEHKYRRVNLLHSL